jgi:hypothetical protein
MLLNLSPGWLPRIRCSLQLFDIGVASRVILDMHLFGFVATLLHCFHWSNEFSTSFNPSTIRGAWCTDLIIGWSYGGMWPIGY